MDVVLSTRGPTGPARLAHRLGKALAHQQTPQIRISVGLGLSIVRRLAERHGLRLELRHQSGWTTVSLMDAPRPTEVTETGAAF